MNREREIKGEKSKKKKRREEERERERRQDRSKLAARGIAELPLIKAIKLVEQLSLIMDVAWSLTRVVVVVVVAA